MGLKILLAEDEELLSRTFTVALEHCGHQVSQVFNGQEAVDLAEKELFDLYIFDIMMPVKSGLEALTELRQTGDKTHTIMLTAMGEVEDKVQGLGAGADDYLTKPISLKELLARLESLERRLENYNEKILELKDISLDIAQQELSASNSVRLSNKETQLLELLMLNSGKLLSTKEIYNKIWARDEDPENDEGYVYIYISYLRQKLRFINSDLQIVGEEGGDYRLI